MIKFKIPNSYWRYPGKIKLQDKSELVVFLDETGNHGMNNLDDNYPVFGLCASLFRVTDYRDHAIPDTNRIKFRYFKHEGINFHSTAIRKSENPFQFLTVKPVREAFLKDISLLIAEMRLTLFFVGMNKKNHAAKYSDPAHPYHYSMELLLERLHHYCRKNTITRLPIVAESRGKSEDATLLSEFNRILNDGTDYVNADKFSNCGITLEFARKEQNVVGLQISDLLAYPIGRWILNNNRTEPFEIAMSKIHSERGKKVGLKVIA